MRPSGPLQFQEAGGGKATFMERVVCEKGADKEGSKRSRDQRQKGKSLRRFCSEQRIRAC